MAHHLLNWAGIESRQFVAFAHWLRYEILVQSAETGSSAADPSEKDAEVDYAKVLIYIRGPLMNSQLAHFLTDGFPQPTTLPKDGSPIYEAFKENVAKLKTGASLDGEVFGMSELTSHLRHQCEVVFKEIAEAQKRNVSFGTTFQLGLERDVSVMDMKMLFEASLGRKGIWLLAG